MNNFEHQATTFVLDKMALLRLTYFPQQEAMVVYRKIVNN